MFNVPGPWKTSPRGSSVTFQFAGVILLQKPISFSINLLSRSFWFRDQTPTFLPRARAVSPIPCLHLPRPGCAGIPPPVRPKTVPIMSFLKKLLDTTIYLYISISIYVNIDLLCSKLPLSKFSHQVITFYSQPDHEMGLPHEEPMYVRIPTGIPKDVV